MATIGDVMLDGDGMSPEDKLRIVEALVEHLAKAYCKTRKDIPAWRNLTTGQRQMCRRASKKLLESLADFCEAEWENP